MASHCKEVISRLLFERGPWDAIDSEFEKRIPFDEPSAHEDCLRRQVETGEAAAHRIIYEGKRVGLVVTKIEEDAAREFVIVAIFCDAPVPLSREIQAACYRLAQESKCISMRFHTVRPAAARIAADEYGYRLTEVIMRKAVSQ
jgi:hypothetical protein